MVTTVDGQRDYQTVFGDIIKKRDFLRTEAKNADTFESFADVLGAHNGNQKAISRMSFKMGSAYDKGGLESLGKADIVFDKCRSGGMVNELVNRVPRTEANQEEEDSNKRLKASEWFFRKFRPIKDKVVTSSRRNCFLST